MPLTLDFAAFAMRQSSPNRQVARGRRAPGPYEPGPYDLWVAVDLEPEPVDDRRLARLQVAARAVVEHPQRHTPLERQWAKQVVDLTVALREARDELARRGGGEHG